MKQILRFFFLSLKRWLKSAAFCITLLLFPLLMLALHSVSIHSESNCVTVLLYCEQPDALTETIFSELLENDGQTLFLPAAGLKELENAVIRGDAECGYVFPDNLEEQIRKGKTEGSISVYHSSASSVYTLTRELVFAAILHHTTEIEAEEFFLSNDRFDSQINALLKSLPSIYNEMAATDTPDVHLTVETMVGGAPLNSDAAESYSIPVRGLGSVLLFIMGLFGAAVYLQDNLHGLYRPMPRTLRLLSAPLSVLALLLPCALSVFAALYVCQEGLSSIAGFIWEIAAMSAYLLLLTAFCALLAHLLKKSERVFTLLPLLSIAALILCPVFINLAPMIEVLAWLEKLFPPFYYLAGVNSRPVYLLIAILLALLLFTADIVPNRIQNG